MTPVDSFEAYGHMRLYFHFVKPGRVTFALFISLQFFTVKKVQRRSGSILVSIETKVTSMDASTFL